MGGSDAFGKLIARLRSSYRVRAFMDHPRGLQTPVGFRIATPGITMELKALDFVQPDFAQLHAPHSSSATSVFGETRMGATLLV